MDGENAIHFAFKEDNDISIGKLTLILILFKLYI